MVRRTKEDALATRQSLLDAAELLFQAQGVSRTSLNDIARKAGTTRGAIYWHFKDKADLFNAMMERVTLPLEQAFRNVGTDPDGNPMEQIRQAMREALGLIANDERTRRVFEVVTQKVEYVDELREVRMRHLAARNEFLSKVGKGLSLAADVQKITLPVSPANAAQGLHALVDGLIQNWLLDTEAFGFAVDSEQIIDVYLRGLGFSNANPMATARAPG